MSLESNTPPIRFAVYIVAGFIGFWAFLALNAIILVLVAKAIGAVVGD